MDFNDSNVKKILKELASKEKGSRKEKIYFKRLNKKISEIIRFRKARARGNSLEVLDMIKKMAPIRVNQIFIRDLKLRKMSQKKAFKLKK